MRCSKKRLNENTKTASKLLLKIDGKKSVTNDLQMLKPSYCIIFFSFLVPHSDIILYFINNETADDSTSKNYTKQLSS